VSTNPYEPSRVPQPVVSPAPQPQLPYEIDFELSVDDLVAFQLDYVDRLPVFRFAVGCLGTALALVIPVGVAGLLLNIDHFAAEDVIFLIAFAIVVFIANIATTVWFLYRGMPSKANGWLVRYLITRGNTASLVGSYSLLISPTDILERAPQSEHRFVLSAVQKIVLARQHVFIYVSPIQAFIIPRRAFADPREPAALVDLLERTTGQHAIR
jgi:hypothetical protein